MTLPAAADADALVEAARRGMRVRTGDAGLDALLAGRESAVSTEVEDPAPAFLSLLVAESCNLGCSYCIAGTMMDVALRSATTRMTWGTARSALHWFAGQVTPGSPITVNFSGGEPLLNWPVVRRALDELADLGPLTYADLSLNTNATLVTRAIAEKLAEHGVAIATSLDGVPAASDLVRVRRKARGGVSSAILRGWTLLRTSGCELTGFMATFDDRNISSINPDLVDFALEWGMSWLRVDCDVIHLTGLSAEDLVERIWEVFLYGRELGVAVEGFWSTPADNLLNPRSAGARFCGAVSGDTISVHPDGRVSACGFSVAELGRVRNGAVWLDLPVRRAFIRSYKPGRRHDCAGCDLERSCGGGCNIAREQATADGTTSAIDFNCTVYRELTRRLVLHHAAG
ncbi:MAG: radical SAM protein [Kineosporiaceae bacterium]|nr:radical SAM protein [Kineosporiaceae bacterium]